MMRRTLAALVAIAAVVGGGVQLSGATFTDSTTNPDNRFEAAQSFCTNPSTVTVKADRDTYVDQSSPNSNFGTSSDLFVLSKSSNQNRRLLVRVPLPSKPAGCSVTQARLRLFATQSISGRTIQAYRAGAAWTESGTGSATWNNQPSQQGTPATHGPTNSSNGFKEWSGANMVTLVEALYSGSNNGFILRDSVEGASTSPEQKYQSREGSPNSQDPEMIITFG